MSSRSVRRGAPRVSLSQALLRRWHNNAGGLTLDFTDLSACVIDPTTIRNNFFGSVNRLLSITTDPKWILNSSGVHVQTSANTLATEYDSSGNALGVRIEEARTNSIRNSTMVGASAPSTMPTNWVQFNGACTWSVVGTGTESGINYIDMRFSGNAAGSSGNINFDALAQIVAASGQVWTSSVFCYMVAGSMTNVASVQHLVREGDAGGTFVTSQSTTFSPSDATSLKTARRVFTTAALNASTARVVNRIVINENASGSPLDITLRIGWPQLELGAFATSPIPTTSAAVTRNADNVSLATSQFPYSATAGTLYAEAVSSIASTVAIRNLLTLSDGTSNERVSLNFTTSNAAPRIVVVDGGAIQANTTATANAYTVNVPFKAAAQYAADDFKACLNGGTVSTDTAGTLPTVTQLILTGDATATANSPNMHIRSLMYLPSRPDIQALTT